MYTHQEDIVYGRKDGMALTLDVFTPAAPNGAAVLSVVAGGWRSSHDWIAWMVAGNIEIFLQHGYNVFAVVPSSQPRYTLPEIAEDVHRAVRFVRHHSERFDIDANRIGIYGSSAGGHLSLMTAFTGGPGDPEAADPVDRASSAVRAVAQFFAPTDFLNYGGNHQSAIGEEISPEVAGAFDFRVLDPATGKFERVEDKQQVLDMARANSPVHVATAAAPPTLAIHGDQDLLVPLQQSEVLISRLEELGVHNELFVRNGGAHGWEGQDQDIEKMAVWFDRHLL